MSALPRASMIGVKDSKIVLISSIFLGVVNASANNKESSPSFAAILMRSSSRRGKYVSTRSFTASVNLGKNAS